MGCGASKEAVSEPVIAHNEEPKVAAAAQPASGAVAAEVKGSWKAPAGAPFHRLTKIPIKSGSMPEIVKATEAAAFKDTLASFTGFLGVEALSVDDETMLTHSRWQSEEACNGGAAALGKVLKEHLSAHIAGPPEAPLVGPKGFDLEVSGKGPVAAYRVVIMNLQVGKAQDIIEFATGKLSAFKEVDGLVSVSAFFAGETTSVVFAAYNSKAQLEEATPKIGAIMKEMGVYFAGPPTPMLTEVQYSTFAPAIASARPATGATINLGYVVPGGKADEVQAVFKKHAAFMEEFYKGSTEYLISCYFTKAPLFKDPADPSQGATEDFLFTINEEFTAQEAIGRHVENAKAQEYFPEFGAILGEYCKCPQVLGEVYFKIR
jgi:heme-degrading monooxygenase HmoA